MIRMHIFKLQGRFSQIVPINMIARYLALFFVCTYNSDLALEAEFLASLQHPNIIKLRGIVYSGADGFSDGPRYESMS